MNFIAFVFFKGLIMHHAVGTYTEEKVRLHEFATSAPDETEW